MADTIKIVLGLLVCIPGLLGLALFVRLGRQQGTPLSETYKKPSLLPSEVQDTLQQRLDNLVKDHPLAKQVYVEIDHDAWVRGKFKVKSKVVY